MKKSSLSGRVFRATSYRGIAFVSVIAATLSSAAYADQATSSQDRTGSAIEAAQPQTKPSALVVTPNSSDVVHWIGDYPFTAGGFGTFPQPGYVGIPGSLGTGFRSYEDYSYLSNRSNSHDYLDPLKYIPLNKAGDIYLTLLGWERFRYENLNYGNFGIPAGSFSYNTLTNTYAGTPCQKCNQSESYEGRIDLGADLHLTRYLRLYGEAVKGLRSGREQGAYGPAPVYRNDLAVVQAFGEGDAYLFGGKEAVQIGRQLLSYGWLYNGSSTALNVFAPSFDGIRASYDNGAVRSEVFAFHPVVTKSVSLGSNQSAANGHQALWGSYNTVVLPQINMAGTPIHANLDAFYFGIREGGAGGGGFQNTAMAVYGTPNSSGISSVTFRNGAYRSNTVGARYYGTWGNWAFDYSGAYQFGSYDGLDVSAYGIFTKTGYTFSHLPWEPNPFFVFNVTSGGAKRNPDGSGTLNTFLPIDESTYPNLITNFASESNLYEIEPHIVVHPMPNVLSIEAYAGALFRYAAGDAFQNRVFAGAPPPYGLTAFVPGHYIGTMLDLRPVWNIAPHLTLLGEVGYVIAGNVLNEVHAGNSLYLESELDYKW